MLKDKKILSKTFRISFKSNVNLKRIFRLFFQTLFKLCQANNLKKSHVKGFF